MHNFVRTSVRTYWWHWLGFLNRTMQRCIFFISGKYLAVSLIFFSNYMVVLVLGPSEEIAFKLIVSPTCLLSCVSPFSTCCVVAIWVILDQLLIFRPRLGRHAHSWILFLTYRDPWRPLPGAGHFAGVSFPSATMKDMPFWAFRSQSTWTF